MALSHTKLPLMGARFIYRGIFSVYNCLGMSGHSHYATIKRQKETKDAARGNMFSKLAKAISIAAKSGGGIDPNSNFKLRVAIDKARSFNMPKENIERALRQAQGKLEVEEVTYEGFGPGGVAVMVEVATDNRNRTGQEIKNIFERVGGHLAGPGAVSFNFESRGQFVVRKETDSEAQMLKLIDLGVEDMEETEDGIEVHVAPEKLSEVRRALEESGFIVTATELVQKPKNYVSVTEPKEASKAISFLDALTEHEDIQKVFANLDVPTEILSKL